ncbi:PREDICTED: neurotrypsin-like [Branchiostoma belcheri]|uniref:Neurotrypsin-like n=1 Tax=Branchiostoma belcheri TaxID=7741 RepID=A0A6P5AVS6_BRABE|nr:PREDICTED: neurotrypsin-like [Branchiostoma belcheri]
MPSPHVHAVLAVVCSTLALCGLGDAMSVRFRLVNSTVPHRGRLELYRNSSWQPVCADSWGRQQTEMACRSLGFPGAVSYDTEALITTNNSIVLNTSCVSNNATTENCTTANASCISVNGTVENCSFVIDSAPCRNNSVVAVHCHEKAERLRSTCK